MTKHKLNKSNKAPTAKEPKDSDSEEEAVEDSDDEEISEDEAFNSEDEKKYGAFFANRSDDSSSDSDSSSNEEEGDGDEEGDGGEYMLSLLDKLDTKKESTPNTSLPENEFSNAVHPSKLSLHSLLGGISDTQSFGPLQKSIKSLQKKHTTATPLPKPSEQRSRRKIHYREECRDVSTFQPVVKMNKEAETLDFRPHNRKELTVNKDELVAKFSPQTEFEKEIAAALEKNKQKKSKEDKDDLGHAELTMEDLQKRHGELAKMRALMFYEEQKRHQRNKIKSKTYRKIRRNQKQKLEGEDGEHEKEEMERMQERMTLAHRNTSKWAKRQLRRGKGMDLDTRRALSAQIQKGDDLKKKMNSVEESEEEIDEEELIRQVRGEEEEEDAKGVFGMAFMKRGLERQRERAKQEAKALLQELTEAMEEEQQDKDDNEDEVQNSPKEEVPTGIVPQGTLVAKQLVHGNSNSVTISGNIEIDMTQKTSNMSTDVAAPFKETTSKISQFSTDAITLPEPTVLKQVPQKQNQRPMNTNQSSGKEVSEKSSNPWLKQPNTKHKKSKKGDEVIDVSQAVSKMVHNETTPTDAVNKDAEDDTQNTESNDNTLDLTQEQLIQRAFAAPTDAEIEAEFQTEKNQMHEEDKPNSTEKEVVDGWGSWAGEGAPPPPKRKRKFSKRDAPPIKKQEPKRRDADKKYVIINEKRMKKTAEAYQIKSIPYPFSSKEEYERSMLGGVGGEWNVSASVKDMTRPEVLTRPGVILKPLGRKDRVKRKYQTRAPAKF